MKNLKKDALHSLSWLFLLKYSTRILDFLKFFILTRILLPTDIGSFVLTTTILITFESLTDTGFNFAFIHKQENIKKYARTIWYMTITRGIFIGVIIFISAGFMSDFFRSEQLKLMLQISSIIPLLKGLENPGIINFYKDLKLKKEFPLKFIPSMTSSIASILLALIFKSAEVLIIGIVFGTIIELALSFILTKAEFKEPFSIKKAKELFHYGKYLTLGGVFTLLITQLDSMFVGRVFGTSALAYYELSFKLANLAFTELTDVVSRVSFPLFAKIKNDKQRLFRAFQMNLKAIAAPSILVFLLFLIFPSQILRIAFGQEYANYYYILQILSIYGLARSITGPLGPLFLALGRPQVTSLTSIINFLLLAILIYPLSSILGLSGVAWAMTISYIIAAIYLVYETIKIYNSHILKSNTN